MLDRHCLFSTASHPALGGNMNGPCVIEVPNWVPSRLGRYYMYFAHHKGHHIHLAYADALAGPWTLHTEAALSLQQTPFVQSDLPPERGVAFSYAHIASPNLHVDESTRRIVMYYHGLEDSGDQPTRACFSGDGLTFDQHSEPLTDGYFAGFVFGGKVFGVTLAGRLCRGNTWLGPFEYAEDTFAGAMVGLSGEAVRHCGVLLEGDRLEVYFTRIGDAPERILRSTCVLKGDWRDWRASRPMDVLAPKQAWEGALAPVTRSVAGIATPMENALRDPFPFAGHLFYAAGGESAIGVAGPKCAPPVDP